MTLQRAENLAGRRIIPLQLSVLSQGRDQPGEPIYPNLAAAAVTPEWELCPANPFTRHLPVDRQFKAIGTKRLKQVLHTWMTRCVPVLSVGSPCSDALLLPLWMLEAAAGTPTGRHQSCQHQAARTQKMGFIRQFESTDAVDSCCEWTKLVCGAQEQPCCQTPLGLAEVQRLGAMTRC